MTDSVGNPNISSKEKLLSISRAFDKWIDECPCDCDACNQMVEDLENAGVGS